MILPPNIIPYTTLNSGILFKFYTSIENTANFCVNFGELECNAIFRVGMSSKLSLLLVDICQLYTEGNQFRV